MNSNDNATTCPMKNAEVKVPSSSSTCPVNHGKQTGAGINPFNGIPLDISNTRSDATMATLSTHRVSSSIPKTSAATVSNSVDPEHQPKDTSHWIYPSEIQYVDMMKRGMMMRVSAVLLA